MAARYATRTIALIGLLGGLIARISPCIWPVLPDAIRRPALVTLTMIGLGLIFPAVMHLLERPFARIPLRLKGLKESQTMAVEAVSGSV